MLLANVKWQTSGKLLLTKGVQVYKGGGGGARGRGTGEGGGVVHFATSKLIQLVWPARHQSVIAGFYRESPHLMPHPAMPYSSIFPLSSSQIDSVY